MAYLHARDKRARGYEKRAVVSHTPGTFVFSKSSTGMWPDATTLTPAAGRFSLLVAGERPTAHRT